VRVCLRGLWLIPGALDHRERRILAESGVGFGQAAPIEDAAGCGGNRGGMAAGVAEADWVHRTRLLVFAEAALVEQHFPAFFLAQELADYGEHARSGDLAGLSEAAVLQHPHHFAGRSHLVEFRVGEIARLDRQDLGGAAVAFAFGAVALKACASPQEDGLTLRQDFRRRLEGRLQGLGGDPVFDGNAGQGDVEFSAGLPVSGGRHLRIGQAAAKQECEREQRNRRDNTRTHNVHRILLYD